MSDQSTRYATVEGVQEDLKWLHKVWQDIRDSGHRYSAMSTDPTDLKAWDTFATRLMACADADAALTRLTGFRGCVWAPKACPESGPMVCAGCAALRAAPAPEAAVSV